MLRAVLQHNRKHRNHNVKKRGVRDMAWLQQRNLTERSAGEHAEAGVHAKVVQAPRAEDIILAPGGPEPRWHRRPFPSLETC